MNRNRWVRRAVGPVWVAFVWALGACAEAPEEEKAQEDQPLAAAEAPSSAAPHTAGQVAAPETVAVVPLGDHPRTPAPEQRPPAPERRRPSGDDVDFLMGGGGSYPDRQPARHGDRYSPIVDNAWQAVVEAPLSTFSIDVDTASYANVRRFLQGGQLPPSDAVRIEEMLNYFSYDLPQPAGEHPVDVFAEVSEAPWNPANRLLKVSLQGRRLAEEDLPPAQLVFLIDVSGSMNFPDRLPLLQQGLERLVEQLRPQDRVAIVVYAGQAGVVLPSTAGDQKATIQAALRGLRAEGSTAGGAGIRLAYQMARQGFIRGGNNRVILATDGDFNVGLTDDAALVRLIEEERKSGVFLTILGVGRGNYQDARMERLAGAGNGQAAYLDTPLEAERVLVSQLAGTLHTLAQDVKLQLEFNPAKVKESRLIGYENRVLAAADFNNDGKDAGDLGAGHSVTALYELVPADAVDPLRYRAAPEVSPELLFLKLRYKQPGGTQSILITRPVQDTHTPLAQASADLRFASAVAELGLLLRGSPHRGSASFAGLIERARGALGPDLDGRRIELVDLAQKARRLAGEGTNAAIAR